MRFEVHPCSQPLKRLADPGVLFESDDVDEAIKFAFTHIATSDVGVAIVDTTTATTYLTFNPIQRRSKTT